MELLDGMPYEELIRDLPEIDLPVPGARYRIKDAARE